MQVIHTSQVLLFNLLSNLINEKYIKMSTNKLTVDSADNEITTKPIHRENIQFFFVAKIATSLSQHVTHNNWAV